MVTCAVKHCKNTSKNQKDLGGSFHRFPKKNPKLCEKFIRMCGRKDGWSPGGNRICGVMFCTHIGNNISYKIILQFHFVKFSTEIREANMEEETNQDLLEQDTQIMGPLGKFTFHTSIDPLFIRFISLENYSSQDLNLVSSNPRDFCSTESFHEEQGLACDEASIALNSGNISKKLRKLLNCLLLIRTL